jgi:hypothetical protein
MAENPPQGIVLSFLKKKCKLSVFLKGNFPPLRFGTLRALFVQLDLAQKAKNQENVPLAVNLPEITQIPGEFFFH